MDGSLVNLDKEVPVGRGVAWLVEGMVGSFSFLLVMSLSNIHSVLAFVLLIPMRGLVCTGTCEFLNMCS